MFGGPEEEKEVHNSWNYQNDHMDTYIKEKLLSKELEKVQGILTFESFLRVYRAAIVWNRVKFAKKKKEYISKRREALKDNNMETYRDIMIIMSRDDEKCLETVIEEILEQVDVGEKEFQEALEQHLADQQKQPLIREALEDAQIERGEGAPEEFKERLDPLLSKKETIATQQKLQDLSVKQI